MSKRERTRLLTSLGIAAGIGLVLVLAYQFHLFTTAQQTSHDLFYRLQNPDRYGDIPSRFVIVAIDSKTLDRLGRWSGWDRTNYARLIDNVKAANAGVVALDVGSFEPAPGFLVTLRPHTFLSRMEAGGVLVSKVNERSV